MRYINNFNDYIIEGISKNHPIQELNQQEKLGIILLGTPGAGKSTFAQKIIIPQLKNVKSFSTDDVSLLYTKDPNVYKIGSAELNIKRLKNFITTGQNFIYDTTGTNEKAIYDICNKATKNGYKLVFILVLIDLSSAKKQNITRALSGGHKADEDYIKFVYQVQNQTTKNYIKYLKPESFYIVLNKDGKYRYYKHLGNKILKRKVDKYIPMNESQDQELLNSIRRFKNNIKSLIRVGTPDEIYEDYFLELKECENFRVTIDKGKGFVTYVEISGMIDANKVESEFNRILNKMKTIKERLHNQFNFDCHFMIWLNGKPQQDLNVKTYRNDDYKFKGVGSKKRGCDRNFYYTDSKINHLDGYSKPFPDDKVAIDIKFMIV
jgi:predicted ABC-type ATPase